MQKTDIIFKDNKLHISGEIDFFNMMAIYKKSLVYLKKNSKLYFDFCHLKSSNSAALVLIIEWIKFGETENKFVCFKNLPQELMMIAKVAGIDKMILTHVAD